MQSSIRSRFSAKTKRSAALLFIAAAAVIMPLGKGWSSAVHIPIDIEPHHPIYTGTDFPVGVTLDNEGPAPVSVYSDPPGAVTFSGTINGTSAVLPTHVDPTLDPSEVQTVTVYVQSDGGTASTEVPVAE